MAATPKNGVFTFVGKSGRLYGVNAYFSDVNGAFVTWNPQGAAGSTSQNFWQCPEDVVLRDVSIVTGMADTTGLQLLKGNTLIPGTAMSYANLLTTITTRVVPSIGFRAGSFIQASQF